MDKFGYVIRINGRNHEENTKHITLQILTKFPVNYHNSLQPIYIWIRYTHPPISCW